MKKGRQGVKYGRQLKEDILGILQEYKQDLRTSDVTVLLKNMGYKGISSITVRSYLTELIVLGKVERISIGLSNPIYIWKVKR